MPLSQLFEQLGLGISSPDGDGSEELRLRLGQLPASLSVEVIDPNDNRRIKMSRNSNGSRDVEVALSDPPYLQIRDVLGTAPETFSLKLSAISRERSNGNEAFDAATAAGQASQVEVTLQRQARPAAVTIQPLAPQLETASPLWQLDQLLAITPANSSDRVQLVLSGLSASLSLRDASGTTLQADAEGNLRFSSSELQGMQLQRPADFSGTLNLTIETISTAAWGGKPASSPAQTLSLAVEAVANTPLLHHPAPLEGRPRDSGWLDLGHLNLQLTDADGSERGELLILGLPTTLQNTAFSQPAERIDLPRADGTTAPAWRLDASRLAELQVWLPNLDGDLNLTLIPRSVERGNGDQAEGAALNFRVLGGTLASMPLLSGGDLVTSEDTPVPLLRASGGVIDGQLQGDVQAQELSYRIALGGDAEGQHRGSFVRWDSSAGLWREIALDDGSNSITLSASDWGGVAWLPSADQSGEMALTVEAISRNRLGTSSETSAPLNLRAVVRPVNDAPEVWRSLGDRGLAVGRSIDLDLAAGFLDRDPGDSLRYSITLNNDQGQSGYWLTVADGHLVGTPTAADLGSWDLQIRATDSRGLEASQTLRWVVGESNEAPTVLPTAPASIQLQQNDPLRLDLGSLFSDPDQASGDRLTYSIRANDGLPIDWLQGALAVLNDSGVLEAPTNNSLVGSRDLTLRASDRQGLAAEHRLRLQIANVNDAPTVQRASAIPLAAGLWEERFALTSATPLSLNLAELFLDPDQVHGQPSPSVTLSNLNGGPIPAWVEWDAATGQLQANPGLYDGGSYSLALEATDPGGLRAVYRMQLEVNSAPQPTSQTPLERRFQTDAGLTLSLDSLISDPDQGDVLEYAASLYRLQPDGAGGWLEGADATNDGWLMIRPDANTGESTITLSPSRDAAGRYKLQLTARDKNDASGLQTVELDVIAANSTPVVQQTIGNLREYDNKSLTLNMGELFSDRDLSDPLPQAYSAATDEQLSFSFEVVAGDQDWLYYSLDGNERPNQLLSWRDSNSGDGLNNDLLRIDLPGVNRELNTTLRLTATDRSGSKASQDVYLTLLPRAQTPTLPNLQFPGAIEQESSLRLGQLLGALPEVLDAEGDQLSLRIRTLPGVQLSLPAGFLGTLEKGTTTTPLTLSDGQVIALQEWTVQISADAPEPDLALLPELILQLSSDTGVLQPSANPDAGQTISLPIELRLDAAVRQGTTTPVATGTPQLRWLTINNQAPVFDWGSSSRFIRQEVGDQPQGVLANLNSLFSDPDTSDTASGSKLTWSLSLPAPLEGLVELDQASGTLRWKAGATLSDAAVGAHRIVVKASDQHYALGNETSSDRGVIQLFVKIPGAPPSAMEDLITRLQNLPSVNGTRSWSLLQPTDTSSASKNALATSEALEGEVTFLASTEAVAALPKDMKLDDNHSEGGFDPIGYSLATDQPQGWYSLADFAIAEQDANSLIIMKGYDPDRNPFTTELAYRSYNSRFVSFNASAQLEYRNDFLAWLQDQQLTISNYASGSTLLAASERQLLDAGFAAAALAALPTATSTLGPHLDADGSALLIDSDGDGKVDYIRLLLLDNGTFDLDPALRRVHDPMALLPVIKEVAEIPASDVVSGAANAVSGASDAVSGASDALSGAIPAFEADSVIQLQDKAALALQLKGGEGQLDNPQSPGDLGVDQFMEAGSGGGDLPTLAEAEETLEAVLSVELQDIVETSKETLDNVAESIKSMFSNLLGKNNMVSTRLLGGLLVPAGGSSIADRILSRLSPGGDHHLRSRNRKLFGRWALAGSGLVLTLSNGRVQIKAQRNAQPNSTSTLNSTRILALLQRSPDPSKALRFIERQLQQLQHGNSPIDWSIWMQELLVSISLANPLERWRARASLSRLQRELDRLSAVDAGLMDVLMAAELQSCLSTLAKDGVSRTIEPSELDHSASKANIN